MSFLIGLKEVFIIEAWLTNREGIRLYCRIRGDGPPILLIHGSMVDADFFDGLSACLSGSYQVISYDRRGYSRSDHGEDCGLAAQVNDAEDILLQTVQGPAAVVGCSLGALVAMRLAADRPGLVSNLFLHEPPLLCFPDILNTEEGEVWSAMKALVQSGRYRKAVFQFLTMTGRSQDPRSKPYDAKELDQLMRNGTLFMEKEFLNDFFADEAHYGIPALRRRSRTYCLAGDSSGGSYAAQAAVKLAEHTGCPLVYVPGGHNGARDLPREFAAMLLGLLCMSDSDRST